MARLVVATAAAAVAGYFGGFWTGVKTFGLVYGTTGFLDPNAKVLGPKLSDLKAGDLVRLTHTLPNSVPVTSTPVPPTSSFAKPQNPTPPVANPVPPPLPELNIRAPRAVFTESSLLSVVKPLPLPDFPTGRQP